MKTIQKICKNVAVFVALAFSVAGFLACGGDDGSTASVTTSSKNVVLAFSFSSGDNSVLSKNADGTVLDDEKKIYLSVPAGTAVTALVATFSLESEDLIVKVSETEQKSGTTPNDFTNPVTYTVFLDKSTIVTYEVIVKETQIAGNYEYITALDCAIITKYTGSDESLEIPNELGGYPVKIVGKDAFRFKTSLTSVTIPVGVTTIGNGAFQVCTKLTSVTIPDSVTTIGDSAFYGCDGLTSVTIPDGVTTIGERAFFYCDELASVTIPAGVTTIGEWAFGNCGKLVSIAVDENNKNYCNKDGVVYTKDELMLVAYPNARSGTSYTILDSVTTIFGGAFFGCTSLTSVTIPAGVTTIEDYAFGACGNLALIDVDENNKNYCSKDGVVYTKDELMLVAYPKARSGTSYTILDSVTTICRGVFYDCTLLTSVTIPDSVTTIGDFAFESCDGLTSVTIPDSVTTIGDFAFESCDGLTSVTIPDSVTTIGEAAFSGCDDLTSVTIPDSVTSIGKSVFSYCGNLTSVTIPAGVTAIGNGAFSYCENLTSVTIPDSVITIGDSAFYYCDGLTSVTIPAGVTTIGDRAFGACGKLALIDVDENNKNYCSKDGVVYTKDELMLVAYPKARSETSYTILDSVTTIFGGAFFGCDGLTSVEIPSGVTTIGNSAFSYCEGLTSVEIPSGVITIGGSAFSYCKGLTSVTIPAGVTAIGDGAFYGCLYLASVTVNRSLITHGSITTLGGSFVFGANATSGRKIYVPADSVDAYKEANYWSGYANSIESQ